MFARLKRQASGIVMGCRVGPAIEGKGRKGAVQGEGLRVEGSGFRAEDRGLRVEGRGMGVEGRGSRVGVSRCVIKRVGLRFQGQVFRLQGAGAEFTLCEVQSAGLWGDTV